MPKVKLGGDPQKDAQVKGTLAKYQAIRGYSDAMMAQKLKSTPNTWRNRMKRPETFTLAQLRIAYDYLKVPREEREGAL